jgi:hypothetical protein
MKKKQKRQKFTTLLSIAHSLSMQFRRSQLHFHNFYSFKFLYVLFKAVGIANSQTNIIHILKTTKYIGASLRYGK